MSRAASAARLDRTFAALADPTRRGVIELLRVAPRRAGELGAELGMSAPALSRHLKALREAGIVEESEDERDARARVYELCQAPFRDLGAWLAHVESHWTGQLASFAAHVEQTRKR